MVRPTSRARATEALKCIAVRVATPAAGERAAAEAYAAGAVGLEEREEDGSITLLLYAPAPRAEAVCRSVGAALGPAVRVGAPAPIAEVDWSEAWKAGLGAIAVSPRLLIRPSFVSHPRAPERTELVIDPGQAFGTGAHASTLLALEWIDALVPTLGRGARVLDVGAGTGILALAALGLGCAKAVALDLDPCATDAMRANAEANRMTGRLLVLRGPPAALVPVGFDLVVANLLRSEMLPLLGEIAVRTRPGGHAVLSGLLESDRGAVQEALRAVGLRVAGARQRSDANGDRWSALLTAR